MASSHQLAGQTPSRRPLLLVSLSLLFAMPFSSVLIAQTTTSGGLTGVITDQSMAVVPKADVEIRDNAKGTTHSTKTDRDGVYQFFFLAPAKYLLTVTNEGFRKESRVVNVLLGPPVSVNVTLEIAKTSSEVTVTGEAPLVQAENGDVSATMNQKQISEIPNPGNDLTYIVQTTPGVVMNTDTQSLANFSILGMPGNSYLYTMDGMNDNDNCCNLSQVGSLILLLGQNQIQEATVVSGGYSGQFGGAAGGNVNYITKSGSNKFHGNAQYYWNGRVFNANDWFDSALRNPRPFDIANQWAGSFGGPIKNDKLFFFFDTEGLHLLIPQPSFVTIPSPQFEAATIAHIDSVFGVASASDAFYKRIFSLYNAAPGASPVFRGGLSPSTDPTGCTGFVDPDHPNGPGHGTVPCARYFLATRSRASDEALTSGRVDWIAGLNDRAFLRLQYDHGRAAVYTDPISPVFDADNSGPWWQAQLSETHTFGPSAASQFLLAGSYFALILRVKNPSQALSAFPTVLGFASGTFNGLGGEDGVSAFGFGRRNTQYQFSEDVVKTWGKHKLGFGAGFARIHWSELANSLGFLSGSSTIGTLTAQTLYAFYQGGVDPANPSAPLSDSTLLAQSFTSRTNLPISFSNLGFYAQDEWHARPNLTLTLALRADHYSNPVCKSHCFARLTGPFGSMTHDPDQPYNQAIVSNQEQALESTDTILWSPRFSFAWQPFGVSHNSVLRGGVGVFYDPLQGAILDFFSGGPPLFNAYLISGDNLTPNEQTSLFKDAAASNAAFVNGFAAGQTLGQIQAAISQFYPPGFSPPGISAATTRMHSPQFQRWSLEWQQALGVNSSASVGYFGNHGIHEMVVNPSANAYGFGSLPAAQCTRPPVPPCADARFSRVTQINTNAVSNYNGMVISFKHQFTRWTQGVFQANYTYGHAFDEVSNGGLFSFTLGSSLNPQNPNNLGGSYGPAEYDVRHSFNASYVWELPLKAALHGRGPDYLVKGWQVSGTIFARTGFPYTVFDSQKSGNLQLNNYFGQIYSVPVGPLSSASSCGEKAAFIQDLHPCLPPQVLRDGTTPNPGALFVQAGCETGFNAGHRGASGSCDGPVVSFAQGRNRFRGPGYFNTDFGITKYTKIRGWENATLGIGFQFFNLFNHPNFGFPDNSSSDPALGQIFYLEQPPTSILGAGLGGVSPRMIQLKVQLQF
jgi:hypothetical protein